MRRLVVALFCLAALNACTPADEEYCQSYGVGGTPEFSKCLDYYHAQDELFRADLAVCSAQADQTYPQILYDTGRLEPVVGGPFWAGRYAPGEYVMVEPDMRKNAELDRLRARIIDPCMSMRGWNSSQTWQAGRHTVSKVAPITPTVTSTPLPWLNKGK